jgi:hypothetical protein
MKQKLFTITSILALMAAGLSAQTGVGVGVGSGSGSGTATGASGRGGVIMPFNGVQQADSLGTVVLTVGGRGGRGGQGVTGSPVSAREETKTVQTLGDGTLLESSDVTQFYRDSQGRTRTDRTVEGETTIQITDPVASARITLNPAAKFATRVTMVTMAARGGGGAGGGRGGAVGGAVPAGAYTIVQEPNSVGYAALKSASQQFKQEDLGLQMQNGVMAEGTRVTRTIPAGTIGNNRDLHVVNEQWYSKDLQMMVKTVNSDPRFGVTTYEMTNISHDAPDAGLFMIPAGYTITEQAGRGRGAQAGQGVGGGR